MSKGDSLGEFEQIVLLAVMRLQPDAYGLAVREEIAARTGRDVTIGAVYATLDRLESKSLLTSSLGEATAVRGGRAKRLFRLTADGEVSLSRSVNALQRMAEGLALKGSMAG